MAPAIRIYLFHGNDSLASSRAVRRWLELFQEKHGSTSRHIIDADELSADSVLKNVQEVVGGSSLFNEPKLVLIKRATSADKNRSTAYAKAAVAALDFAVTQADATLTFVVWEEKQLPEAHPIRKWFATQEEKQLAKVHTHSVPHPAKIPEFIRSYLAERGFRIDRQAEQRLLEEYRQQEKAQRVAKKLRAADQLAEDTRSWWLTHVLDTAMLQAEGEIITATTLEQSLDSETAVSVFEIVNAVGAGRWADARRLLREWGERASESDYFGLYALLRNHFKREAAQYPLELLAEIELISKNVGLEHAWLVELFLIRLEEAKERKMRHLLSPKKLWLATLPRS